MTAAPTLPPRKPPMTAEGAREIVALMRKETRSKAARIKMAEMAISIGNYTEEARDVMREFLKEEHAQTAQRRSGK